MNKDKKVALLLIGMAIVWSILIVFYFNYNLKIIKQDYDAKITVLGQLTAAAVQSIQGDISNLSSQTNSIDTSLKNFKKQNEQEIQTLEGLIEQIEQQSDIKLNELKEDLNSIRISSADFSAIVDDVLQSVVSVKATTSQGTSQGSGAIIDSKGYIVTNVHVVSGASSIRVATYSGKTYDVTEIIGYDSNADIAVMKIDAPSLKALGFGDSDALKVGEKVIAAGNPAGLSFTVTEGIVSAFRTFDGIDYIQTDVPINPGNSGGPLINVKGEIGGINNFKVGEFESLGFAIASNEVSRISNNIIANYEASNQ